MTSITTSAVEPRPRVRRHRGWSTIVERSRPITVDEIDAELVPHPMAPVPGREIISKVLTVKEVLVTYSDREMALTFEADGHPSVMKRIVDQQTVTPFHHDHSKVSFDIEPRPGGVARTVRPAHEAPHGVVVRHGRARARGCRRAPQRRIAVRVRPQP